MVMATDTARDALKAQQRLINDALNGLDEYAVQIAKGHITSNTVKSSMRSKVITDASNGGVDISAWDGSE